MWARPLLFCASFWMDDLAWRSQSFRYGMTQTLLRGDLYHYQPWKKCLEAKIKRRRLPGIHHILQTSLMWVSNIQEHICQFCGCSLLLTAINPGYNSECLYPEFLLLGIWSPKWILPRFFFMMKEYLEFMILLHLQDNSDVQVILCLLLEE